jgi:hypothetical protein
MQSGRAIREAVTLEREKEMEFNTIMQALVKDLAEQMRPLVADMVRVELATHASDKALGNITPAQLAEYIGDSQLATIAEHLSDTQLVTVGENISVSDLAAELTEGQLTAIAGEIELADLVGEIDLSDLASEFDSEKIYAHIDIDEVMRDFFSNNTFSIRP